MKDKPPAIALVVLFDEHTSKEEIARVAEVVFDHLAGCGVVTVKHARTGTKHVQLWGDCGCCYKGEERYERYTFEFSPSKIKRRELDYIMEGVGITKYKLVREGQRLKHPVPTKTCGW